MGDSYIEKMNPENSSYFVPLHDHDADIIVHLVKFLKNSINLLGLEPRTHLWKQQTCVDLNHAAKETLLQSSMFCLVLVCDLWMLKPCTIVGALM